MKIHHKSNPFLPLLSSKSLAACSISLFFLGAGLSMAQSTWSGAAGAKWNDAGNWDVLPAASTTLNFGGEPANMPTDNDFSGFTTGAINLTNNGLDIAVVGPPAGTGDVGFTLGTLGQSLTLGGSINTTPIVAGGAALTDTINLNLILNANRTIGTNGVGGGGSHNITVNGIISETGGARQLTKGGSFPSGTLTLAGNNNYTGLTVIETGTVAVSKISDSGDSNLGYGNLRMAFGAQGATLNYTGSGNITARTLQIGVAGQATGTGGATINANGTNGGTGLVFSAPNFTVAEPSASAASRTLTLGGSNTDANQISGVIADVSATTKNNLAKANGGLWIVSGTSTYTGLTTVSAGTLAGIGTNAFGSTSGISIAGSGTLSLRGDSGTSFQKASDSSLYTVTTSATGSTINVDRATPAGTAAKTMTIGALGSTSTAVTYQLNFTGANNTSLSAGAMTGSISTAAANVTVSNNIAAGGNLALASYTSANTTGGETVTFTGSGNTSVTGAITPSATVLALTKSGGGTLRLDGSGAYTGLTNVTGGALHLNNANALPASGALTLNGGVLGLGTGNFTRALGTLGGEVNIAGSNSGFAAYGADRIVNLGGLSASMSFGVGNFFTTGTIMVLGATTATHTVDFQNPIVLSGTRFFRADDGAAVVDARLSGAITGATTFSKAGTGTLELTNTGNAWTNTTFIDSGTLRLGAADVLPSTTVVVKRGIAAGNTSGILDLNGFSETIGALTLGESANDTNLPAQTPSVVNSSITPATLTLGGDLTYESGNTSNQNGQATISTKIATGTGGTRNLNVEDGSATEDLVISGELSGNAISKLGAGTLVLTTPAFSGNTTVTAGTMLIRKLGLQTNANPNNDASTITVATGAVLNLDYSGTDVVTSLVIGANPPVANGVYGSADFPGIITGTGTITVGAPPSDPYLTWAGPGVNFDADANNDGVDNGLAWLLGASGPNVSALDKLPIVTQTGGNLKLTFDMLPASARDGAQLFLEHSNNLGTWTSVLVPDASGGTAPVTFLVSGTNPLDVEASVSSAAANGGKLFGRLKAVK